MNKLFRLLFISTLTICSIAAYSNVHICPSQMGLKQRLTDKGIMRTFQSWPTMGWAWDHGEIDFFDSFGTTETWVFHFEVLSTPNKYDSWNLFQAFLDNLPKEPQIANDEGIFWRCWYPAQNLDEQYNHIIYTVFAVLKKP